MIEEAAEKGVDLVAFPESFLPGYPDWECTGKTPQTRELTKILIKNSLIIPSPLCNKISEAARKNNIYVCILRVKNITMVRSISASFGSDRRGNLLGKHRKLTLPGP